MLFWARGHGPGVAAVVSAECLSSEGAEGMTPRLGVQAASGEAGMEVVAPEGWAMGATVFFHVSLASWDSQGPGTSHL